MAQCRYASHIKSHNLTRLSVLSLLCISLGIWKGRVPWQGWEGSLCDLDRAECLQPPHPLKGKGAQLGKERKGKGSTIITKVINCVKLNINIWQRGVIGRLSLALIRKKLPHPWRRVVVAYL